MAWHIRALQTADANGIGTGRWRLTATSDEDGGGPWGDVSHDHPSAGEAEACEQCDEYVRKKMAALREASEREELDWLKAKDETP